MAWSRVSRYMGGPGARSVSTTGSILIAPPIPCIAHAPSRAANVPRAPVSSPSPMCGHFVPIRVVPNHVTLSLAASGKAYPPLSDRGRPAAELRSFVAALARLVPELAHRDSGTEAARVARRLGALSVRPASGPRSTRRRSARRSRARSTSAT